MKLTQPLKALFICHIMEGKLEHKGPLFKRIRRDNVVGQHFHYLAALHNQSAIPKLFLENYAYKLFFGVGEKELTLVRLMYSN